MNHLNSINFPKQPQYLEKTGIVIPLKNWYFNKLKKTAKHLEKSGILIPLTNWCSNTLKKTGIRHL